MSNLVQPVYRTRAVMRYLLIVAIALGLVAIFLLATVSANNNLFNDYYMNRSYAIAFGSLPFSISIVVFTHL